MHYSYLFALLSLSIEVLSFVMTAPVGEQFPRSGVFSHKYRGGRTTHTCSPLGCGDGVRAENEHSAGFISRFVVKGNGKKKLC